MSLYQLASAIEGWAKAHGGDDKPEPPSDEDYDAMMQHQE